MQEHSLRKEVPSGFYQKPHLILFELLDLGRSAREVGIVTRSLPGNAPGNMPGNTGEWEGL
jgi:hypothetical protein